MALCAWTAASTWQYGRLVGDAQITGATAACCDLLQYTTEQLIGLHLSELETPSSRELGRLYYTARKRGRAQVPTEYVVEVVRGDGTMACLRKHTEPLGPTSAPRWVTELEPVAPTPILVPDPAEYDLTSGDIVAASGAYTYAQAFQVLAQHHPALSIPEILVHATRKTGILPLPPRGTGRYQRAATLTVCQNPACGRIATTTPGKLPLRCPLCSHAHWREASYFATEEPDT